jgi:integrase/recombinase XerC
MRATLIPLDQAQERFLLGHQARNHSASQLARYGLAFRYFDRFLAETNRVRSLRSVNTEALQRFALWLAETPIRPFRGSTKRSVVGVHGVLKDWKAFSRYLMEEGYVDWVVKVRLPKLPQRLFPVLSEEEQIAIFSCPLLAGKSDYAVRNRALFALLLDTGLRRAEIANLRVRDIEQEMFCRVVGKGDKERRAPFQAQARDHLRAWLKLRARIPDLPADAPLFLLKPSGVSQLTRRVAAQSGVAARPHRFRHSAASMLVRQNVDLVTVKTILGHSSLSTTAGYVHLSDQEMAEKHAAASPFAALQEKLPQLEEPIPKKRFRLKSDAA